MTQKLIYFILLFYGFISNSIGQTQFDSLKRNSNLDTSYQRLIERNLKNK